MPLTTPCNPDLLHRAIGDALSESEEQSLAAHLSDCVACRRQLEAAAGDDQSWRLAATLLGDLTPRATVGAAIKAAGLNSPLPDADDDAFDVDFAVQFLSPSDAPDSIGRLGEIEIREVIGRGAMGVVLKGWQQELNRFVAVKVMSPYLAVSGAARRRFEREAQAAAAILHPNVMPIHSVSSTARLPYLVMPYLACESLQQRLDRDGALPLIELLQIGVQVARGLAAAHAQGLVHRDVKPANILLERGVDRVMLTDFGLARAVDDASLTRSGVIAGTPQYMSPEQARGDAVDQRSDLFSFGSVMYAMAAGRAPFRAESSYAILRRLTESAPRSLQDVDSRIPNWLVTFIERLHARDRDLRIQSASEVADVLEQCLAHVRQPTACALPSQCVADRRSVIPRRTTKQVALAVAATACAVAIGWSIWNAISHQADPNIAAASSSTTSKAVELPANTTTINSPPVWDDGIDVQLDDLRSRIGDIEEELEAP
jgi:serine/threonine-protein kinase